MTLRKQTLIGVLGSLFFCLSFLSCNSSTVDEAEDFIDDDLLDVIDDPERKTIDVNRMGVHAFFNQPQFGTDSEQYREIRDTLGLNAVRTLIPWEDYVQASPGDAPDFTFADRNINSIPANVDVLAVVAHAPSWMQNSANWIDGNPRITWCERWFRTVVARYANTAGIIAWEIWNEPDQPTDPWNAVFGLDEPANYYEMLERCSQIARALDPTAIIVNAATRSIQQNFPATLDYNKELINLGAENLVDVWGVHFYGKQLERVVQNNGVEDFLNGLSKPIWITESGQEGPTLQLDYVERIWPFLRERIPGIDRIYYYRFASPDPIDANFALRTTNAEFPVSDLYLHLQERAQ